jgi:hypothetical protein
MLDAGTQPDVRGKTLNGISRALINKVKNMTPDEIKAGEEASKERLRAACSLKYFEKRKGGHFANKNTAAGRDKSAKWVPVRSPAGNNPKV